MNWRALLPRRRKPPPPRQSWFTAIENVERAAGYGVDQDSYFSFNGVGYSGTPGGPVGPSQERMEGDFVSLVNGALKGNSVIWSCERLRVKVFSQARFRYQRMVDGSPGDLHDSPGTRLQVLATPWNNATTGDLLARMRLHSDFGGNAYVVKRERLYQPDRLRLLRPDWVSIIMGSDDQPGDPNDVDAEIIAYLYWPGGWGVGREPDVFLPDELCHYAPMPDPAAHYRGMSWLNPVIAEMETDRAATEHTMQFFRNGVTTQVIVTVDKDIDENAFERFMRRMNAETRGIANAYKTIYVTGGVDAKVANANLADLDLKNVHGSLETRIAAAAGTPPILVGLSEGLSAGQYNIYGQAKRAFVDGEVHPDWQNLCGSMETIVAPPAGSRLWYDDADIPYLREDQKDQAEITREKASAFLTLVNSGVKPDAAAEAVGMPELVGQHTGLYSVQLQPPSSGTMNQPAPAAPAAEVPTQLAPSGPRTNRKTDSVGTRPGAPANGKPAPAPQTKPLATIGGK